MRYVRLIHWNEEEARERAATLEGAGYKVTWDLPRRRSFLLELGKHRPAAIIIDLERLPSQGRDLALLIRKCAATRRIPLVFAEGEERVVARVRGILPDVAFTAWARIRDTLERVIANPPPEPRVPDSIFAGYSGTPLPKKLGIRGGMAVGVIDGPDGFAATLGPMPENVDLREGARGRCGLLICFVRSCTMLKRRIAEILTRDDYASVWFAWPKKASGTPTDLSEKQVRESGLAAGLVDYKICAIDATWSGLLFARRGKGTGVGRGRTNPGT